MGIQTYKNIAFLSLLIILSVIFTLSKQTFFIFCKLGIKVIDAHTFDESKI
jgi:hypothetical protein